MPNYCDCRQGRSECTCGQGVTVRQLTVQLEQAKNREAWLILLAIAGFGAFLGQVL